MQIDATLLDYLEPDEREELELLLAQLPVWMPDPRNKPQCQAYDSPADELLYGGSAGGGKTALMLGTVRTRHENSLILRRVFPELERSVIADSFKFFGDRKFYNTSKHVWRIDGRRIEFGHMERVGTPEVPGDEAQYASAPYDFIGFDQLEQFPEYAYMFMFSRLRTVTPGQRIRIVSSANWVGEHLEWILRRWSAWLGEAPTAGPGELKWYYRLMGEDQEHEAPDGTPIWDGKAKDWVTPRSRTFIPAGLSDNPYLGPEYRAQLQQLPEPLRSALLYGIVRATIRDNAYQVIPREWVKAAMARWVEKCPDPSKPLVIGADIAHGGDDQTAFAPRRGTWFDKLEKHEGRRTPTGQAACDLLALILEDGVANMDVIGVGASAYDIALERKMNVMPINFSVKSHATDKSGQLRFINKRAELYWAFREALDPDSGQDIMLPLDPELEADLCAPRWSSQTNGIKVEDKEEIKKRLGRSPDCGDAVVLSWADATPQIY